MHQTNAVGNQPDLCQPRRSFSEGGTSAPQPSPVAAVYDRRPASLTGCDSTLSETISDGLEAISPHAEDAPEGAEMMSEHAEGAAQGLERVPQGLERADQGLERLSQGLERASEHSEMISGYAEKVPKYPEVEFLQRFRPFHLRGGPLRGRIPILGLRVWPKTLDMILSDRIDGLIEQWIERDERHVPCGREVAVERSGTC
jgi:hypothetical protein